MTTMSFNVDAPECVTCAEPDVLVVVCDHVLNGMDPAGGVIRMTVGGPQDLVRHACNEAACPDWYMCGDCWSNL